MKKKLFVVASGLCLLAVAACLPATPGEGLDPRNTSTPVDALSGGVREIGGLVLGGGDQTPEGLLDAPRIYLFQVRLDGGEEIQVTYIAYPPTPVGRESPIRLKFAEGQVKAGQYMKARGTYDAQNQLLTVAGEGDFIETYPEKP